MASGEIYDDAKVAFTELRDLIGVEIIFASRLQLCVAGEIYRKSTWQQSGFIEEASTHVDMLDDDYADFVASGINDEDSIVLLNEIEFKVIEIDTNPATPVVRLVLTKDK